MLINPIMAMLENTATRRYHPMVFRESPLPGGVSSVVRHLSSGHHTEGFDTREEALLHCTEKQAALPTIRFALLRDFQWDGVDIPAQVAFFNADELCSTIDEYRQLSAEEIVAILARLDALT